MSETQHDGAFRVAVVQRPPVLLDRQATLERALAGLDEAVGSGARLVVFPEAYVPGYPEYIWRMRPGEATGYQLAKDIHGRLIDQAVDLEGDHLQPLQSAAKRHGALVVIGVHERDGRYSRATLYNTVVTIGADGSILNRHRKLVPTDAERMVWSPGDGSGLRVLDTPIGRLGGLICWENYMPLARFSLYAQGVQLYVAATWDEGDGWIASMRHIALEGRCWVIGAGCAIRASNVPPDFPGRDALYPDPEEWLNHGDSVVLAPTGKIVAGPLHGEFGILLADCDPAETRAAHLTMDVAGHYNRPDVFHLTVDRSPRQQIIFEEATETTETTRAAEPTAVVDLEVR